jgi:hypothetical protein
MDQMPPEALLDDFPGPMRAIAEDLRAVVRRVVPDAIERVRPGWRLIGYDLPRDRGRTTYFCFVLPEAEHVHLGFEYGTVMRDADGLLRGAGITKKVRWVTLTERGQIPDHQLELLVHEGARVARMSRAERQLQALDVARAPDATG